VELTVAGEIFYRYIKEIHHLTNQLQKEIDSLSDAIIGDLVIGASLTTGEIMLPHFLGPFKQKYPDIQISIEVTNTNQILNKIQEGILDIGLIEAPSKLPDLEIIPFQQDELVLIASPQFEHSLLDKENQVADVSLLLNTPLILREKGSGTCKILENGLQRKGIDLKQIRPFLELGSTEAIKSIVEYNAGVSVISKRAIEKELKLKSLIMYRFSDLRLVRHFYYVHKKDTVLSRATEIFIKELTMTEE
jgi:DNA-binding transcriptional LysR family regulator